MTFFAWHTNGTTPAALQSRRLCRFFPACQRHPRDECACHAALHAPLPTTLSQEESTPLPGVGVKAMLNATSTPGRRGLVAS